MPEQKYERKPMAIDIPFNSSGASKEMPMNTEIIPNMNIVVRNASNTCLNRIQF